MCVPSVLMVLRGADAMASLLPSEVKANILRGAPKVGYNALILKVELLVGPKDCPDEKGIENVDRFNTHTLYSHLEKRSHQEVRRRVGRVFKKKGTGFEIR